jgi:hypothetical protein
LHHIAVETPQGVYCEGCLPLHLAVRLKELFAVTDDMLFDTYPLCESCGKRHDYVQLTGAGEKYEVEIRGPVFGDVMLTNAGPGGQYLELSVVEDSVLALFRPDQREALRSWIQRYLLQNPEAIVWHTQYDGSLAIDESWSARSGEIDPAVALNRAA